MPFTRVSTPIDGTAMQPGTITGNLAALRAWLNGGVLAGDIVAGAVLREHIVPPRIAPFPFDGMHGELTAGFGLRENQDQGDATSRGAWSARRQRESIWPHYVTPLVPWRTRIGRTFDLEAQATVDVVCQVSIHDNYDPAEPSPSGTLYPYGTGAAGANPGGYLTLYTYRHDTGTWLEREESRDHIYPQLYRNDLCQLSFRATLAAGRWSTVLCYQKGDIVTAARWQFDLGRANMSVSIAY